MADSSSQAIVEGVLAVNKPPGVTSAAAIRDIQKHFSSSKLFQPWLRRETERLNAESPNQKQKRRWKAKRPSQVKMGHGGTLDPMATGVLVLGIGSGTKKLNNFLGCTKSYEAVVLFGAATDSYDAVGKLVGTKPFDNITKEKVVDLLEKFRGEIMQRPPIFSALHVQGKRLYEYAREGIEVPVEIEPRQVEVKELEMVEWMDGGTHEWQWPEKHANEEEVEVVKKISEMDEERTSRDGEAAMEKVVNGVVAGSKRQRDEETKHGPNQPTNAPSHKRPKSGIQSMAAGALQDESTGPADGSPPKAEGIITDGPEKSHTSAEGLSRKPLRPKCLAPACRLRMTVTSGFYVRSLCHDLGIAAGSFGLMASLVRTRQADFELGNNVLEYDDLDRGESAWGPRVEKMLRNWSEKEP